MTDKSLAKSIQQMVLNNPLLSVEQICEEAFGESKSRWTLYKELNPEDGSAKVGAMDLVSLMRVCRDAAPLQIMAMRLGYALLPLPAAMDGDSALELDMNKATKEFSDVVVTFADMMADGVIEPQEFEKFEKEVREALSQMLLWMDHVKEQYVGENGRKKNVVGRCPTPRKGATAPLTRVKGV